MGSTCESCHTPEGWRDGLARVPQDQPVQRSRGATWRCACAKCHLNGAIKGTPEQVLRLPLDPAPGRPVPDAARRRLRELPPAGLLDRGDVESRRGDRHAAEPGAPRARLRRLPHEPPLRRRRPSCYSCHAKEYQATTQPTHQPAGFPTQCEVCHRRRTPRGRRPASSTARTSRSSGCTPRRPAPRATRTTSTRARRATASAATARTTTAPPARTTRRPGSRPRASPATGRRTRAGRRRSTTAASSRSRACTPRRPARPATRTTSTRARRATASAATGPTYDRTTSPNHAAAGFPTTCESCHKASDPSWRATFNHSSAYPLVGVHATQACTACHKNNVYKGTPRDCVGCHRTNYDRTTSPNHAAAGFPTTCESCHRASDASWRATFNHNAVFPWSACTRRRPARRATRTTSTRARPATATAATARTTTARPTRTTPPPASRRRASRATAPRRRRGRRVSITTGSSCSPGAISRRRAVRATRTTSIAGTPRDCYPCHQAQYDRTTNPNHRAAGFPTTCETCHRYSDYVVQPGPVQSHVVPDHVGQARRAGVRRVPHRPEQLQGVHLHDVPHAVEDGREARRAARATATTRRPATRATRRGRTLGAADEITPPDHRRRARGRHHGRGPARIRPVAGAESTAPVAAARRAGSGAAVDPALGPGVVLRQRRIDDRRRRLDLRRSAKS